MSPVRVTIRILLVLFALLGVTASAHAQGGKKGKKDPAAATAAVTATAAPSPAPAPAEHEGAKGDDAEHADKPERHGPITMHVGVMLEKLTKFELGPGTYNAEMIVNFRCDGEPCKPDFDVTNGKITGKEKLLDEKTEKAFRVKAELDALVDLSEFPFDKHVLYVGLVDKGDPLGTRYVVDEGETGIDPSIKLAGWQIAPRFATHVEGHKLDPQHEVTELQFGIAITRPRLAAVFKTLVPVFFMVFVAGFTLLLKPKSAAGRLSAATGGLMTVVMFHLSSTSSLPPLGYLTKMDKFMIATYVVYLVNIALSVVIVRMDEKKNERGAELAYLTASGLVPGVALIAWLTVFLNVA
jgi:hypothetical protein